MPRLFASRCLCGWMPNSRGSPEDWRPTLPGRAGGWRVSAWGGRSGFQTSLRRGEPAGGGWARVSWPPGPGSLVIGTWSLVILPTPATSSGSLCSTHPALPTGFADNPAKPPAECFYSLIRASCFSALTATPPAGTPCMNICSVVNRSRKFDSPCKFWFIPGPAEYNPFSTAPDTLFFPHRPPFAQSLAHLLRTVQEFSWRPGCQRARIPSRTAARFSRNGPRHVRRLRRLVCSLYKRNYF